MGLEFRTAPDNVYLHTSSVSLDLKRFKSFFADIECNIHLDNFIMNDPDDVRTRASSINMCLH